MSLIRSKITPKRTVSKLLKELPDNCTFEDIQYHLYVLQKIEKGLAEANHKKSFTTNEVRAKLGKWLKK